MLTADERRRLVEKPFPVIHRLTSSYPWSGTLIQRDPDSNTLKKRLAEGETIRVQPAELLDPDSADDDL